MLPTRSQTDTTWLRAWQDMISAALIERSCSDPEQFAKSTSPPRPITRLVAALTRARARGIGKPTGLEDAQLMDVFPS